MTRSPLQRDLPARPGGQGSAWGRLDRSTAATAKSVMCMEDGKSGERRWCKMRLSTGDFSVDFARVLHDGWKGVRDEISQGGIISWWLQFYAVSRQTTTLLSRPAAGSLWYPGALGSWKADRRALERRR